MVSTLSGGIKSALSVIYIKPPFGAESEIVEKRVFRAEILFVVGVTRVVILVSQSVDKTQLRSAVVAAAVSDYRDEREFRDLRSDALGLAVTQRRQTVHILELVRNFESKVEIFVDEEVRTERKSVFHKIVVIVFVAV